jgi:hypothetical protein
VLSAPATPRSVAVPAAAQPATARTSRLLLLLALLAGAWLGRAFSLLPPGLENVLGIALAAATALVAALAYRRWARRTITEARARSIERRSGGR